MLKVYYLKVSDRAGQPDAELYPLVSPETAAAAASCRNVQVRRRKLLGEAMARSLLQRHFGLRDCTFCRGRYGKPYVPGNPAFFNVSHSGDYVVCAVSGSEVGVDVEQRSRFRMEVARRFFHCGEVRALETLPEAERPALFSALWSVKESYLKYTGTGLSGSLSSFEVRVLPDGITLLEGGSPLPVHVRECPLDADYRCYVCSPLPELPELLPFP